MLRTFPALEATFLVGRLAISEKNGFLVVSCGGFGNSTPFSVRKKPAVPATRHPLSPQLITGASTDPRTRTGPGAYFLGYANAGAKPRIGAIEFMRRLSQFNKWPDRTKMVTRL